MATIATRTGSRMNRFLGEPVRTKPGTRKHYKRTSAKAERRASRHDLSIFAGFTEPLPADEHEHPLDLLDPGFGLFIPAAQGGLLFIA